MAFSQFPFHSCIYLTNTLSVHRIVSREGTERRQGQGIHFGKGWRNTFPTPETLFCKMGKTRNMYLGGRSFPCGHWVSRSTGEAPWRHPGENKKCYIARSGEGLDWRVWFQINQTLQMVKGHLMTTYFLPHFPIWPLLLCYGWKILPESTKPSFYPAWSHLMQTTP